MSRTIVISEAERDLRGILHSLEQGESATLVDDKRRPLAKLVSLKPDPAESDKKSKEEAVEEWVEGMEKLAKEVDAAWIGEKSALDELRDNRNARLFLPGE